jgi:outer membrane protein TolC
MTMRKAGVMQAFPNSRKRASQRERAAALVALGESESRQLQLEIARAASQAWISVLSAQQLVEALETLKPQMELQIQNARSAVASARGSTLAALSVQAALVDLNDQLIQAQRDLHNARSELQRWVGDTAARPLGREPNFRELPVAREKILASVHRHAELIVVDRQVALARSEVELARADKRADWSAELVYSDRGAAFADMVSLEFRVALPLFSRYRQDPMIAAKRADLSQREAQREAELRMHAVEVGRELTTWEAAHDRIESYERERLPLARDRSKAAIAGYQSGVQPLDDVLASRTAEIEAHRDYAALTNELGQAWAFLRYLEPAEITP